MKRNFPFILIVLLGAVLMTMEFSCSTASKTKHTYACLCDTTNTIKIQFEDLYIRPEAYNSQLIEIEGLFVGQFEQSALFRKKRSNNLSKTLWIEFNDGDSLVDPKTGTYLFSTNEEIEKINGRRIKVRGLFHFQKGGHLDQYYGEIHRVCYIETL